MKKAVVILLVYFFFFGFIEHSFGQRISNKLKSKIEKQVDSVFHIMIKYAENLEYDKLNQGVDDKYNAGFIINGSYYSKFDSLITSLKTRSRGVTKQSITIQKEKITVLSENIVILTAYGESKANISDGNSFTAKFYWSFVYEKTLNDWKVIQSHQSGIR